ncbi:ribose-phosphate diphosphokinase [Halococcoides cellulosivorans]|uniref:Ribose-phosphate pyrophosphokinase n=1 Tax=Halococcoides cellulosivorans TaxID=1679096 RepID=A0A2R4WXQ9_9EURY|nr:ribose-phosphate diphosphokinase [Halococcoides cellulosivorans]AWB26329.1 ribose-phosphate pyrophosphokinase [Halococcoides cellulosivorans]
MIFSASSSQALAAALADATAHDLGAVTVERFADGERMARIHDDPGAHAVVVAATTSDAAHVECLQLQDAVREAGADSVTTVLPYMGYARQDDAFRSGEPVSARAMARAIATGTDRVVLVNPHEKSVVEYFDVPVAVVDASDRLAAGLPDDLADPLVIAPDEGATALADGLQNAIDGGATDYFEKTRNRETGAVTVEPSDADVAGRDVVLVDDIVATGSTMSEAIAALADRGARRVFVTCVHPVLAGSARERLERAGTDRIVGTDTIDRSVSRVSAAPAVATAIDPPE